MRPWGALLACMLVSTAGQVLLKLAVIRIGKVSMQLAHIPETMQRVLACPWFWIALLAYGAGFYLWLAVLSGFALHEANLYFSANKILLLFISIVVFGEVISPRRWAGAALIIAGLYFVSTGAASPEGQTAQPPAPITGPESAR